MKNRREFAKCVVGTIAGIATVLVVKPSLGISKEDKENLNDHQGLKLTPETDRFIPTAYHLNQAPLPKVRYLDYPICCST